MPITLTPMTVNGFTVTVETQNAIVENMKASVRFTAGDVEGWVRAAGVPQMMKSIQRGICRPTDYLVSHRAADRLTQKLRKAGFITKTGAYKGGATVWKWVS